MKKIIAHCLMMLVLAPAFAQTAKEKYSKARIWLSENRNLKKLAGLGVETDHGLYKPNRFFVSGFSQEELQRIKKAGFSFDTLVEDIESDYIQKNAASGPEEILEDLFDPICNKVKPVKKPRYWRLGSMGGHMKYEEMLAQLDSMRLLYPNLISSKFQIDTTKTREGRPIWTVRLSDNPNTSEPSEPQGLLSAVHHAREPVGMHQLLFFMWYLLENYAGNPEIKALVDNTELYFVPCLNPDGYIYNQVQSPQGGGMWRKNRRNNGNGTFGVDLNRNYGYNWGFDDFGSSPDPESDTYRGDQPFSEPETRAMKAFCERQNFKIAQNYHTYSNLIIYPWGYDNLQTQDSVLFKNLTGEMKKQNNYRTGTAMQVLNYNSNGSSDDFMYSTTPGKPKILAMTPEVGDWFWPLQNEIIGLCQETMYQNLSFVRALHPMIKVLDSTGLFHKSAPFSSPGVSRIRYKITRIGSVSAQSTFTVSFKPFGINANGLPTLSKTYSNLPYNQSITDSLIMPDPSGNSTQDKSLRWELTVSNGVISWKDTLKHFIGDYKILEKENCDVLSRWSGSWVRSTTGQQEGAAYLRPTESTYQPGMNSYLTRIRPFDLRSASYSAAELSLWTKFDIEQNYDFAAVSISTDSGSTWTNVCTDKTNLSSPFSQQAGLGTIIPIWDGRQAGWRKEYLNLQPFLGQKVWIRFRFFSDDFTEMDGFGLDNIQVYTNYIVSGSQPRVSGNENIVLIPNPGKGNEGFSVQGLNHGEQYSLEVFNSLGRKMGNPVMVENAADKWQSDFLPAGCYTVVVSNRKGERKSLKWLVMQ
jgi:carboxypeptidase T